MLEKLDWNPDMVVPVPIGIARKADRGYNQASLMAYPIALSTGIQFCSKALKKVKDTPSQVGLSIEQRIQNVKGAFLAESSLVSGKSVLLVDDICTSGATLNTCTQALLTAGSQRVFALTLARADIKMA